MDGAPRLHEGEALANAERHAAVHDHLGEVGHLVLRAVPRRTLVRSERICGLVPMLQRRVGGGGLLGCGVKAAHDQGWGWASGGGGGGGNDGTNPSKELPPGFRIEHETSWKLGVLSDHLVNAMCSLMWKRKVLNPV